MEVGVLRYNLQDVSLRDVPRVLTFTSLSLIFPWQLKTPFLTEKEIQKQKTEEKAPKTESPPYLSLTKEILCAMGHSIFYTKQ